MITISEIAADKIKEILEAEGVPSHALRVTTAGGGCGCGGEEPKASGGGCGSGGCGCS